MDWFTCATTNVTEWGNYMEFTVINLNNYINGQKVSNEWKKMRILHSRRDYTRLATTSLVTYASLHVFASLFNWFKKVPAEL